MEGISGYCVRMKGTKCPSGKEVGKAILLKRRGKKEPKGEHKVTNKDGKRIPVSGTEGDQQLRAQDACVHMCI